MPTDVFFDLDGTLTDPYEGISRSIRHALEYFGAPVPDADTLKGFIGPPLYDTFTELLGEGRAKKAVTVYRERFARIGWRENLPYAGIGDVLAELETAGRRLFVATSKPRVFAERIVEHFGLAGYFTEVYGAELDGTRGDKTELLEWALARGACGEQAVMIGDRRHDMIGATNNNMFAIGVTWGYGSIDELESAGAQRIAHVPEDITRLLIEP
jgi:phosphoglycolate phosphatase